MSQKAKSIIYFTVLVVSCAVYAVTDDSNSSQDNLITIENEQGQEVTTVSYSNQY
ncbi:hypothetical protein KO500_02875 [Cellulophaga baltica]|uniref:hypothetical protein n=1 Tax=Cellulophaga TaxID=104264 RepID=UPI001C06631A|nr:MULTISPECIES: hypothetical protein [Cellulophaga]MBU2995355.1 hypothetical protein [Cellulophaga baltica]MDO6766749.1 hypothetical protein [Cellulophaga sp. 1_MG-2023]